jgi:hypothetical protein
MKQDKVPTWKEMYEVGKTCGAFNGKECLYSGDVFWSNLRKNAKISAAYSLIYL